MSISYKHEGLTEQVISCFYAVYNDLGYGFLESVYQNALAVEFRESGISFDDEVEITVFYNDEQIGEFYSDFVVEDSVVLEIKAASVLDESHEAQLLNYLNATDYEVGLLLNFGESPEITRKIFDNERKDY